MHRWELRFIGDASVDGWPNNAMVQAKDGAVLASGEWDQDAMLAMLDHGYRLGLDVDYLRRLD